MIARLPLLAKELIETAAAPRTYLLRVAYAVLLALGFISTGFAELSRLAHEGVSALGAGKGLFSLLVGWQFASIYLFLPALSATEITREEERGNLDLLRVSGIGARSLLYGKLAARVVAMLALLAIGLPFAGFAYSLGGVSLADLGAAAVALLYATVQVGAWSLWCSASASSSPRALMRAYLLMAPMLGILVPMAAIPLYLVAFGQISAQPATLFIFAVDRQANPLLVALQGLPILGSAAVFLVLAVRALRRRHLLRSPEQRRLEAVYRRSRLYDLYRQALERADERKVILPEVVARRLKTAAAEHEAYADSRNLPVERPVAWREERRVPRLSHPQVAGPFALLIVATALGFLIAIFRGHRDDRLLLDWCQVIAGGIGMLVVAMQSAAVVSGERGRHSLDVLLTLPLTTSELVRDKLAGGARWLRLAMAFVALPAAAAGVAALAGEQWAGGLLALALALPTQWVLLHVALWLGLAVSLRTRDHQRAVLITLTVLILWCVLPPIIIGLAGDVFGVDRRGIAWRLADLLSPAWMPWRTAIGERDGAWAVLALVNLALYGAIWAGLRWWCLASAQRRLRREIV